MKRKKREEGKGRRGREGRRRKGGVFTVSVFHETM